MKRKLKIGPSRKGKKQSSNVTEGCSKPKEWKAQLKAKDMSVKMTTTVSSVDSSVEANAVECLLSLAEHCLAPVPVKAHSIQQLYDPRCASVATQTDWSMTYTSVEVQTVETFCVHESPDGSKSVVAEKPVNRHCGFQESPLEKRHGKTHTNADDVSMQKGKSGTYHAASKPDKRHMHFEESPIKRRHDMSPSFTDDVNIRNGKSGTGKPIKISFEESPLGDRLKVNCDESHATDAVTIQNAKYGTDHAVRKPVKRHLFQESPLEKRRKECQHQSQISSEDVAMDEVSVFQCDDSSVLPSEKVKVSIVLESSCHDMSSASVRSIGTQCARAPISFHEFEKMPPKKFYFFTGVTQENFTTLFKLIGGDEVASRLKYSKENGTPAKPIRSTLSCKDRLFMTLMRLRRGVPIVDVAYLFGISIGWASTVIYTWIRFLSLQLQCLSNLIFPSAQIQNVMKNPVKKFPNLRAIIDCTEIKIQHPYDFRFQTNSYSKYKHTNTIKYLVVITCFGGVCFISQGFEGRMSDKQVLIQSGFLKLLQPGDTVMCDRGFDIEAELNAIGVNLIIPPFKGKNRKHFSARECAKAKSISSVRIFVEMSTGKLKQFRILRGQVPNTLLPILDDVMNVVSILSQLSPSFID